jgi:hypothetical protein
LTNGAAAKPAQLDDAQPEGAELEEEAQTQQENAA